MNIQGLMQSGLWMRSISLAALMVFWQLLAVFLQSDVLPTPIAVLGSGWYHLTQGSLLSDLGITLLRVLVAFFVAMIIGTAVGILMGSQKLWDNLLDGMLVLGLNIPALVTIILCYIWFGLTEVAAVLAVAVNKIPTVIVTVREGARAVDRQLMAVAQVYHLPRYTTLTKVYLPQLQPYLVAAARNGLALIWKIVLVVELLGRSNGVGFQLGTFFQFFDIQSILAYTLTFALIVLAIEGFIMRPLEQHYSRWRS